MLTYERIQEVGFEFTPEQVAQLIVKEEEDRKPHYVFWAGVGELTFGSDKERFWGLRRIRRGIITGLPNSYGYWDSDQGEKGHGFTRNPLRGRQGEVWRKTLPGQTARDLERNFNGLGLKVLRSLTEATADIVNPEKRTEILRDVSIALIMKVGKPKQPVLLREFREMFEQAIESRDEDDLIFRVGMELLDCINNTDSAMSENLSEKVGEMKDRNKPGGIGLSKLDEMAYEEIKILGQNKSDYEVDGDSWQHAMQDLLLNMGVKAGPAVNDQLMTLLVNQQSHLSKLTEQVNVMVQAYAQGKPPDLALISSTLASSSAVEEPTFDIEEEERKAEAEAEKTFQPVAIGQVWEEDDIEPPPTNKKKGKQ